MLLHLSDTGLSKLAVLLLAKNLYIVWSDVNDTFCEDQDFNGHAIGWMMGISSGL